MFLANIFQILKIITDSVLDFDEDDKQDKSKTYDKGKAVLF